MPPEPASVVGGRAHSSETTAGHRGGALARSSERASLPNVWSWWSTGPEGSTTQRWRPSVRLVRLPRNLGPAGGFGAGMEVAFADPSVRWAYLCEDDVGLFSLPSPRLADVVEPGRGPRPAVRSARGGGGGLRATVRGPRIPHRQPGPSPGEPARAGPGRCGQLGGDVAGASRSSTPASSPTPSGSSASRTSISSVGSEKGGFEVLVDAVSARAVADEQTSAGRAEALGRTARSTNTKRGGRTTTPATPSSWPGVTAARRGTCGTWPTRPGICRRRPGATSAERSSMASGTAPGAGSVRIPTTVGREGEHCGGER